jgi:large repetitive protein
VGIVSIIIAATELRRRCKWLRTSKNSRLNMNRRFIQQVLMLSLLLGLAPALAPTALAAGQAESRLPDLVPVTVTYSPANVRSYQPIIVEWTIENRGGDAVLSPEPWHDALSLSADSTLDDGDLRLDTVHAQRRVEAGGSYENTVEVTVPLMPTGNYILLVEADSGNDLPEADDANNVLVGPTIAIVGLAVDLAPTALTASTDAANPGEEFVVSWSVVNRGDDAIPASDPDGHDEIWFDDLYFSTDTVLDEGDTLLSLRDASASSQEGPQSVGETYTVTVEATVPVVPGGTYHLLVAVDRVTDSLRESDETNNVFIGPTITIAGVNIDLEPVDLSISADSASWYQPVALSWTVANRGSDAVPDRGGDEGVIVGSDTRWRDAVFLSTDATMDDGDTQLTGVDQEGPLAAEDTYSASDTITVPAVPDGTYYLLVVVDEWERLPESDETNNVLVSTPIEISGVSADLVPTALMAVEAVDRGALITIEWIVVNRGAETIPAGAVWYDSIYLSTDAMLDGDDRLLQDIGSWAIPPFTGYGPVPAGGSYAGTLDVTPPDIAGATYYLLVVIDAGDAVSEADESNNLLAVPFAIEEVR